MGSNIPHEQESQESFPPRKVIHPSNKLKLNKIYYAVILLLFVALLIGLLLWGVGYIQISF